MSVITNTLLYYPVSAILWLWHKVFGYVFGPDSGFSWAFAVVFLVFSLRVVLLKPFMSTMKTTKKMQDLQPKLAEINKKYGKDRQKKALETQKLYKEQNLNPLMGCLPALLQIPVFLGLYHVLSSFNRTSGGFGRLSLTVEETRNIKNYIFNVDEVQSFLDARFFGVPLSSYLTQPSEAWGAFYKSASEAANFGRTNIFMVIIPIVLLSALFTHMNSRVAVASQSPEVQTNPQTSIMNFLTQWIFPLGVLIMAPFMPIANLIYWLSNNIWTYGQQHILFKKMEEDKEAQKKLQMEVQANLAPKPGAKPIVSPKSKKRNNAKGKG